MAQAEHDLGYRAQSFLSERQRAMSQIDNQMSQIDNKTQKMPS